MSYREKMAKVELLRGSLNKLLEFAYAPPVLSLNQRRAIVTTIHLGGSAGCSSKKVKLQPEFAEKSHRCTQNGLMQVFSEKQVLSNPDFADTIMKISSLSAWAYANPNRCKYIMNFFTQKMVPEDTKESTCSPTESVISSLRSNWGMTKTFDLIALSPEAWARKYRQR